MEEEWLPKHVIEATTRESYTYTIYRHIMPTFGPMRVVIFLHPCKGVKTPTVPKKLRQIITPEQFDLMYAELPDDALRLLGETWVESGLRWGELSELRSPGGAASPSPRWTRSGATRPPCAPSCPARYGCSTPFHVTRLGLTALDEVRRRVQQDTPHWRGDNADPQRSAEAAQRPDPADSCSVGIAASGTAGSVVARTVSHGPGT